MHIRHKALALAVVGLACVPTMASARSQIRAVGSSTVYPFATAVAERLSRANPNMKPPVIESVGTGGGIKLFCAGIGQQFPDIANASRRIKASEMKNCAANGVKAITEIQVGIDGIALATAKSTPLNNLTATDIYKALAKTPFGKPNKAKTWKDVNGSLPATPIRAFGPPPTSGTRDAFGELIMTVGCNSSPAMVALKKSDESRHKAICTAVREDGAYVETGENDNLIVQKLESNPGTIGVFGYSYLEENGDKLKGISINGIAPTYGSIASFKYPGSRPLYIYVKNAHVPAIPAIKAFIAEFTKEAASGRNGYLVKRGMIAAPDAIRAKSAATARALTPLNPAEVN